MIVHRGTIGTSLGENTIESFSECKRLNVGMVEFDVFMTLNKELVVFHDDTLNRLFPDHVRANANIWDLTKDQIPESIPLLNDVLQVLDGIKIVVEIKQDSIELVDLIWAAINNYGNWIDVTWGSFASSSVNAHCKHLRPNTPRVLCGSEMKAIFILYLTGTLFVFGSDKISKGNQFWIPTGRCMVCNMFHINSIVIIIEYRYKIFKPLLRYLSTRGVIVVGCEYESGAINTPEEAEEAYKDGCSLISTDEYVLLSRYFKYMLF